MNENLIFYKGIESLLPHNDNITPGAIYHCTDTGNTYLGAMDPVDGSKFLQLFSTKVGAISADGGEIFNNYTLNQATGQYAHAEGSSTIAWGNCSHAEGQSQSSSITLTPTDTELLYQYEMINAYPKQNDIVIYNNKYYIITDVFIEQEIVQSDFSNASSIGTIMVHEDLLLTNTETVTLYRGGSFGDCSHSEGAITAALWHGAHAEGSHTTAAGRASHAEGDSTLAAGPSSHAEGNASQALEYCAHAEGENTLAMQYWSHTEGHNTIALGLAAHAEGINTIAANRASHAEGEIYSETCLISGSGTTYIISTSTAHPYFIICYQQNIATILTRTSNDGEHIITTNIPLSDVELQEAPATIFWGGALGEYSHAEGRCSLAYGSASHAEGAETKAIGGISHSEGFGTTAFGVHAHAQGRNTSALGECSHAEGGMTSAIGKYSHAEGYYTITGSTGDTPLYGVQHVQGQYNKQIDSKSNITDSAFIIGNGTEESSRSNAFRVQYNGATYAQSSYNSTGADYAEYFEWEDLNLNNQDRRGYFVTLNGNQIKIAGINDYILGIVSGQPSIIGNADEDWRGRYILDEFGAFILEDFEYTIEEQKEIIDEETGEVKIITETIKHVGQKYKENPNYDSSQQYIQRADRPEWAAIGMLGVLSVRDDGTCQVNGYCSVADGGIATASKNGYRVIQRVNDHIVKIIFR